MSAPVKPAIFFVLVTIFLSLQSTQTVAQNLPYREDCLCTQALLSWAARHDFEKAAQTGDRNLEHQAYERYVSSNNYYRYLERICYETEFQDIRCGKTDEGLRYCAIRPTRQQAKDAVDSIYQEGRAIGDQFRAYVEDCGVIYID